MKSLFERDLTVKHTLNPPQAVQKNKSVSETSVSPRAAFQNTAMLWNEQRLWNVEK